MASARLLHLQRELAAYYEQLVCKEKARRLAPQEEKVRIQQQIQELRSEIYGVEQEYWLRWGAEAQGLRLTEAEAEIINVEIIQEVESLGFEAGVQTRLEIVTLLQGIKTELTRRDIPASGKLKAAIPLLPGFLAYELELDTAGLLQRLFPTFCGLVNRLGK